MPWTTPGYVASGEADSGKFNLETVDNLQYLYDVLVDGRIDRALVTPGANRDVTSATLGNWTTETDSVTCPSWATRAMVQTYTNGWYDPTANGAGIAVATSLGGVAGEQQALTLIASGIRSSASWCDEFTGLTPGVLTIRPMARRSSGTGTLRADTSTKFRYLVEFLP